MPAVDRGALGDLISSKPPRGRAGARVWRLHSQVTKQVKEKYQLEAKQYVVKADMEPSPGPAPRTGTGGTLGRNTEF